MIFLLELLFWAEGGREGGLDANDWRKQCNIYQGKEQIARHKREDHSLNLHINSPLTFSIHPRLTSLSNSIFFSSHKPFLPTAIFTCNP
jgi:hypothetical protein